MNRVSALFNRWSLSAKVSLAGLVSTGIALSIAAAVHITIEILEFRPQLESENRKLAQVVAANVSAAILFEDVDAMRENLDAFSLIPEVYGAQIRRTDGTPLAQYISPRITLYDLYSGDDLPGTFRILTPVMVQGEEVGSLELVIGLDALRGTILGFVWIAILALLISMVPAVATMRYCKPLILQPIHHLSRTMDRVTTTQDYNTRVRKLVDDEFGRLVDRFNAMLEEVRRRDTSLATAAADMAVAKDLAERANMTKTKFIANMSHELRTPLNAIIGYAEMVVEDIEGTDQETQISDLNRILTAARHLLGLINDVLDVAKIEAGKLEIHMVPTDLRTLIEEAVQSVGPAARQNRNTLSARVADEVGMAHVDPTRFRQCLLNLLSNACKFTTDGEVTLDAAMVNDAATDAIVIKVRDTGIGIDAAHLAQLFEPFVQIDASMTRDHGGSGLGLAITSDLLAAMGGDVSVESVVGEGSCFTIRLPLQAGTGPAPTVDPSRDAMGSETRKTVLVVEDSEDSALLLRRWLEPNGFDVRIASTGHDGIAQASALAADMVILDVDLPDMTGWDVLEQLNRGPTPLDGPIVLLTVEEDRPRALAAGASELITKPVQKATMIEVVEAHIRTEPVEIALFASPDRLDGLMHVISRAGHRVAAHLFTDSSLQSGNLSACDVAVVDEALIPSGQPVSAALNQLLTGPLDVVVWRGDDHPPRSLPLSPEQSATLATSPSELLISINRVQRVEPVI